MIETYQGLRERERTRREREGEGGRKCNLVNGTKLKMKLGRKL